MKKILLSTVLCGALALGASANETRQGVFISLGSDTAKVTAKDNGMETSSSETELAFGFGGDFVYVFPNKFTAGVQIEYSFHSDVKLLDVGFKGGYDVMPELNVYGLLGYGYLMPDDSDLDSAGGIGFGLGAEYNLKKSTNLPLSIGLEWKKFSGVEVYDKGGVTAECDYSRASLRVKYSF